MTISRTYNFKVSATNQVGEGELSAAKPILAATEPEAPAEPVTSTQSSTFIAIGWTEPINNGANVDDYKVLWCISTDPGCSFSVVAASTSGATSFQISGLVKGTTYQFKVQAHNVIGYSESSPAHFVVAADVPDQPASPENDLAVTTVDRIKVNWALLTTAQNGGLAVTHYVLYWKEKEAGDYVDSYQTPDATTATHTILSLSAGFYYDIQLKAFNDVGGSIASPEIRIVAAEVPVDPTVPRLLT